MDDLDPVTPPLKFVDVALGAGRSRFDGDGGDGGAESKPKTKDADRLVTLALEKYRIGRTDGDEAFAVEIDGPNIAHLFRGSADALRAKLSRDFRREYKRTPGASALVDALTALRGEALEAEPEPVEIRIAEHAGRIVFDLGDATGRCVIVRPGHWEIEDRSPVLFRRTALTAFMPAPERGGNIDNFRALLNATDEAWPLLVGWLVAAMIPGIPHPILCLRGLQGTGKTTFARLLIGMIDPSTAPVRSAPREVEQWAMAAAGCWAVCIDNVSGIPAWWSDALCKSCTGDGWIRRRLYTDSELSVLSFRRVVVLTAIDAGALRGDLADRLLLAELERIDDGARREERDLDARFHAMRQALFGGLLNLLAETLAEMPAVKLTERPRLADFGRVLAAVDSVRGTRSFELFMAQRGSVAAEVVADDPVAAAVQSLAAVGWTGTAGELLARIEPDRPVKGWPQSARGLAGRLKRVEPALRAVGVEILHGRAAGGNRDRTVTIQTVPTVPPDQESPAAVPQAAKPAGTDAGTVAASTVPNRPPNRPGADPPKPAITTPRTAIRDGRDGRDGCAPSPSTAPPPGWTPAAWAARLRQMADRCRDADAARAAELLAQAAQFDEGGQA